MHGRHFKILGLSLLALVGVMAVSASAAQAKWLLLDGVGKSVLDLKLEGSVLLSELLVDGLGLAIHCKGASTATVLLQLNATHTVLTGSGEARFRGCLVLGAEAICTALSPGAAKGEIIAKGSGTGEMSGAEVFSKLSSEEFTKIELTGEECPLNEISDKVNGTAKLTLLNPLEEALTHLALIDDEALKFGEEEAVLHGELLVEKVHDDAVLAHLSSASNEPWAIHLVNL